MTSSTADDRGEKPEPVLVVTPEAVQTVLAERASEADPAAMALRVDAVVERGRFVYDLSFVRVAGAPLDDHAERHGELLVFVPARAVPYLRGAELRVDPKRGLALRNKNRVPLVGGLTDDDEVAARVKDVLAAVSEELAAHGGAARLVGHGDGVAYVELLGGCHGCSLSRQTVTHAVKRAVLEQVAAITDVIDVTDHAAGVAPWMP